ncbi:MAG: phosphatidylserine decarboxylase family protein [Bacteroidales bacterium]|nr:phosphatidylserine decarboxylase family protein [Bacteroidales bacterium]MDE7128109.1 phosphatidylserine decarboxylase family protein [Bacteroidales bacterium]
MTIHKDGYGTILGVWIICAIGIFLSLYFIPWAFVAWTLAAVFAFFMFFVFFFFRVPQRETVCGDNVVTSVADGEVVIVDKVYESEYIKGECIQVSVYMNFFNVHVNFWPISGEITYYRYHPGKYLLAFLPKASELNEHTSIAIRNECGEVFFKQLAGTFARRIVCYAKVGEKDIKGNECGIIKFGSRIDMYLPLGSDIKVRVGDEVRACETVIAELHK